MRESCCSRPEPAAKLLHCVVVMLSREYMARFNLAFSPKHGLPISYCNAHYLRGKLIIIQRDHSFNNGEGIDYTVSLFDEDGFPSEDEPREPS